MFYKIIVEASGVEIDTREELEEQHTHTHTYTHGYGGAIRFCFGASSGGRRMPEMIKFLTSLPDARFDDVFEMNHRTSRAFIQ